jgi:prevent-host-death family protein
MMTTVGVRDLKNRLSEYLGRVKEGEKVVVTARGRPVAVISPAPSLPSDERLEAMVRGGLADWAGGKPRGSRRPPRIKGRSIAKIVIEERR